MSAKVDNLMKDIEVIVTDKQSAIKIVALLVSKFDLHFKDYVDELVRIRYGGQTR